MIPLNKKGSFAALGFLALITIGVTGCGTRHMARNSSMNMGMNAMNPTHPMATVKMTIPKKTTVGNANQFSVLVTQQGKPATEVEDVMFEIWRIVPNAKHEIIHAKRTEDGTYVIKYRFNGSGAYDVMYHVVANGNMIMTGPQKIVVTK